MKIDIPHLSFLDPLIINYETVKTLAPAQIHQSLSPKGPGGGARGGGTHPRM